MLGRDDHMIITSHETLLLSHMLTLCVPLSITLLKRECIRETMNPGPFLIIRNTFPTTFIHFSFSAIIKSENKKILLHLACIIKNPNISSIIVFIILAHF